MKNNKNIKKFYINKYTSISIEKVDEDSDGLVFNIRYKDPYSGYSRDDSYLMILDKLNKLSFWLDDYCFY